MRNPFIHERATDDKFVILVKKENVDPGKGHLGIERDRSRSY